MGAVGGNEELLCDSGLGVLEGRWKGRPGGPSPPGMLVTDKSVLDSSVFRKVKM